MNELALFAGAGGGILGAKLLGWTTVCAVEIDPYAASVLIARQNDGHLAPFPLWNDVTTFDGKPWRGIVDVVSGGFPCQDISCAGRGAGITGKKSGLWSEYARVIREVEPPFVFVENSPMLASGRAPSHRGLDRLLSDLAALGFDAEWCVLGADAVGAPHLRKRMWILGAHPARARGHPATNETRDLHGFQLWSREEWFDALDVCPPWPRGDAALYGVDDGVAAWLNRFRALGHGQVPAVAALAWRTLIARFYPNP